MKRERVIFLAPKENKYLAEIDKMEKERNEDDQLLLKLREKIDNLNSKIKEFGAKLQEYDDYTEKMSRLYELGMIDEDSNPVNNEMKLG